MALDTPEYYDDLADAGKEVLTLRASVKALKKEKAEARKKTLEEACRAVCTCCEKNEMLSIRSNSSLHHNGIMCAAYKIKRLYLTPDDFTEGGG